MDELLREGDDAGPRTDKVRVVRAGEVAALRRSSPDSAIVALVDPTSAPGMIAARLAGADVVVPCAEGADPDEAVIAEARTAARMLAERARLTRDQTKAAAHEFAGTASAVAMAAHLIESDNPTRADQLRRLASRGAQLAWSAGRVTRSSGTAVGIVDLAAEVRALGRVSEPHERLGLRIDADVSAPILVDRVRLVSAIGRLIDNCGRAGATVATVRVEVVSGPSATSGSATVSVVDDGPGLPDGWTAEDAVAPLSSGWSPPGDGLGLAEVAEFAADHGGSLEIQPRGESGGVAVVLRFPALIGPVGLVRPFEPEGAGGGDHRVPPDGPVSSADADWALASILEGIARRDPVGKSLEALVATMERYLPDSICSILLLDRDTSTLRHGAGARLPALYRAAIDGLQIGPLAGSCGTAAFTQQEVIAVDVATDERWAAYHHHALPHGLRSCWSRPILDVDRGVVLGTFAVYHGEPWVPGPSASELVQRLTHVAAVAIGTADLHGQLVESEARFRSTFEAAGLGIALVSPSGTIQDANAALGAIAGRPLVGESLDRLLVGDAAATRAALTSVLTRPGGDASLTPTEVRVHRLGEEPVWAAMSGSLIRGPAGEPRHFCIELFDLTERRRVAQARRERAVAEAADRAKSELLALVSHEVRTPLNAVIGFAQVLQTMQLTPERQRDSIEHILGAGRHLLQLINDLLDLTGAEAGQLQLVPDSIAAEEVVAEAVGIVAGLAAQRGVALSARPAPDGLLVRADRQRLRQVLLNLLGNAIKFTPTGGEVEVVLTTTDILVQDNGDGVPADQLPFLFTPFHRAGNSTAEGTGLGLALSQRLMQAMDGDLTLVSSTPGGSVFRLVLPVLAPPAIATPTPTPEAAVLPAGSDDQISRLSRSPASAR